MHIHTQLLISESYYTNPHHRITLNLNHGANKGKSLTSGLHSSIRATLTALDAARMVFVRSVHDNDLLPPCARTLVLVALSVESVVSATYARSVDISVSCIHAFDCDVCRRADRRRLGLGQHSCANCEHTSFYT